MMVLTWILLPVLSITLLLFLLWRKRVRQLTAAVMALRLSLGNNLQAIPLLPGPGKWTLDWHMRMLDLLAGHCTDHLQNLWQADVMRRSLIANMTRDLRTPLTTIQGYLETLQLKGDTLTGELRERYLAVAIKQCFRLNRLVDEFHEMSRLECEETRPHLTHFSLAEVAQHVVQKYMLVAQEREIVLSVVGGSLRHVVVADRAMMQRVFQNLIENALAYTGVGGEVFLKLKEVGEKVRVQVVDTGSGIRPEVLPHLFERPHRHLGLPASQAETNGLGLLVVKRILDLHGSRIQVDSALKLGTTFQFYLPLAKAYAEE